MGFLENLTTQDIFGIILASYVFFIAQQLFPLNKSQPPTVFHLVPYFGSFISYGINPYNFWTKAKETYGEIFTFILFGKHITVALGRQGNELVLNSKLSQVSAEEVYQPLTTPVFGKDVVYDVPNAEFMEQKRFVKIGLSTEKFRRYIPMIVEEIEMYCKQFLNKEQDTMKVLKNISEITILTACRTLQGEEVRGMINRNLAHDYLLLDKGFAPTNFIMPWFPWPHNFARDAAHKRISTIYQQIIRERRASGNEDKSDMIAHLMKSKYKNGKNLEDHQVAHMMIALLMAGQHTSATTGSWMLFHLAERPDLQNQLLDEQKKVLGDLNSIPTYEQLNEMKLHAYVIRETLRMHPPLHSLMRKVKQDLPVPNSKYTIPKGHLVLASPGMSSLDSRYFPEPEVFKPERWENFVSTDDDKEKVDYGYGLVSKGTNSPYVPFGAGRHRCIGEHFAYLQLGVLLMMLIRNYSFKLPANMSKVPEPDYTSMVVLPSGIASLEYKRRNTK